MFEVERLETTGILQVLAGQMRFGFVVAGTTRIQHLGGGSTRAELGAGMYFALDSQWSVLGEGQLLSIVCLRFSGLNQFGGPVESEGRLRYIDNCTDSLLIPPTKLGDPCLNLLVFPPGVQQTPHTHPSFRAGIVIGGRGECLFDEESRPLNPGDLFQIPAGRRHCFHSHGREGLRVIAFHPDSDYGPTDQVHPMINRTLLSRPLTFETAAMNSNWQRLTGVFRRVFQRPELNVGAGTSAWDVPGWDSLLNLQLVLAVETEFKIQFSAPEVLELKTAGDLLELIEEKTLTP